MKPSENVDRIQDVVKRLMTDKGLVHEDAAVHNGVFSRLVM